MDLRQNPFVGGLVDSIAIGLGYLPIAFSFGLAALQAGLTETTTMLISAVVFAGASQFILLSLLLYDTALLSAVVTVILVNARHIFYGPALVAKFPGARGTLAPPLLGFGLTDEVFVSAMAKLERVAPSQREVWYVALQLGAYLFWVGGTALGVTLGRELPSGSVLLREALGFILPALFFALLLEMGAALKPRVAWGAGLATGACLLVWPGYFAIGVGLLFGAMLNLTGEHR